MLEWVMRAADRVDGCVVPLRRRCGGHRWRVLRNGQCPFPTVRIPYAEREPATNREGPMVSFNHRPARTNCQRPLAAKIPRFFGNGGFPIKCVRLNTPGLGCRLRRPERRGRRSLRSEFHTQSGN